MSSEYVTTEMCVLLIWRVDVQSTILQKVPSFAYGVQMLDDNDNNFSGRFYRTHDILLLIYI